MPAQPPTGCTGNRSSHTRALLQGLLRINPFLLLFPKTPPQRHPNITSLSQTLGSSPALSCSAYTATAPSLHSNAHISASGPDFQTPPSSSWTMKLRCIKGAESFRRVIEMCNSKAAMFLCPFSPCQTPITPNHIVI